MRSIGISVAPQPAVLTDSLREQGFIVASQVATRHRLDFRDNRSDQGFRECFSDAALSLCGKSTRRGIEFLLSEGGAMRFSLRADSVRIDLLSGLRARFGTQAVRECSWGQAPNPQESGCDESR